MTTQTLSEGPSAVASPEEKRCCNVTLEKLRNSGASFDLANYLQSQASPLIIVAHPDDEALGVGGQLDHWPGARFVHVTDGAPRDMRDALAAGCNCRADYATLRLKELEAALALAGFKFAAHQSLGIVDQEASTDPAGLSQQLAHLIQVGNPDVVITHPYEGGHPDHDVTAFAVSCACKLLRHQGALVPEIVEMTSYHNRAGLICTGEFLSCVDRPVITFPLTADQRRRKQGLIDCYQSQARVLQQFQVVHEKFRLAPEYDFSEPPHPGTLFYEQYGLGIVGERWRDLAVAAMAELGLGT